MIAKKKIVIGGKAYADIDVLACIAAYTQLLSLKKNRATGIITGPWNQTIPHSIKQWPISIEKSFTEYNNDCDFILVDLSDPNHMEDFVIMDNIVEVYDHHYGYETFWKERLPYSSYIEPVGACATLIWEKYKENNLCSFISKTNANLLYTAIFANTLNFKARVTTERDHQAAHELSDHTDLPNNWIANYYQEVTLGFKSNLLEQLLKDTKTVDFNDSQFFFGQIETWNAKDLLKRIKNHFPDSLSNQNWLINIVSIEEGHSYLYSNVPVLKELITKITNSQIITESFIVTNELWLRKEILKELSPAKLFKDSTHA
jgi:inorganic pyrophosphatase/exopolyphosphatase